MNPQEMEVIPRSAPPPAFLDESKANIWQRSATALVISDQATYDRAVELLSATRALQGEAEAHHRPMISAAHKTHQATLDGLKRVYGPLFEAETIIKRKIGAFDEAQRLLAVEAQREAQRKADGDRLAAIERDIEAAELAGAKPAEVQAIIEEAEAAPVMLAPVAPTYQRAKGMRVTPTLVPTVTNMKALVAFVNSNPQYLSVLEHSQTNLNRFVKAMGAGFNWPGVSLTPTTQVVQSTARRGY